MGGLQVPWSLDWLTDGKMLVTNRGGTMSVYENNEKIANAVNAAEPIANPFPVAAVVFPKLSKASVRSRTIGSKPAISALPPALSAIGPYASVASVIPSVLSMPTAAIPTP